MSGPALGHGLYGKLGEIADAAGVAAALKLAAALGGREIKLSARPDGKLARIVGPEAARAIVEALGAEKIVVPMGHLRGQGARRAEAARLLAEGTPIARVAEAVDVHERTVYRVKERRPQGKTPDLFDGAAPEARPRRA